MLNRPRTESPKNLALLDQLLRPLQTGCLDSGKLVRRVQDYIRFGRTAFTDDTPSISIISGLQSYLLQIFPAVTCAMHYDR